MKLRKIPYCTNIWMDLETFARDFEYTAPVFRKFYFLFLAMNCSSWANLPFQYFIEFFMPEQTRAFLCKLSMAKCVQKCFENIHLRKCDIFLCITQNSGKYIQFSVCRIFNFISRFLNNICIAGDRIWGVNRIFSHSRKDSHKGCLPPNGNGLPFWMVAASTFHFIFYCLHWFRAKRKGLC